MYEDLAAAGEVDEDAGDAAGEFGAFDGGAAARRGARCRGPRRPDRSRPRRAVPAGPRRRRRSPLRRAVSAWPAGVCGGRSPGRCCAGSTSSTTRPRPMRTEMTREAATAARPSSTAAPAGVSRPRVNGSARSATSRPASRLDRRACRPARARGPSSQVASGAAASAWAARAAREHLVLDGGAGRRRRCPAARSRQAARSGPRRSRPAASVRVRRVSTAPVNSRSRSRSRRPARRAAARTASSCASASPARENSSSTRASEPSSASWMPVSAPPTAKAAEMVVGVPLVRLGPAGCRGRAPPFAATRSRSAPVDEGLEAVGHSGGQVARRRRRCARRRAAVRRPPRSVRCAEPPQVARSGSGGGLGGVAYGGRALGLERGDGGRRPGPRTGRRRAAAAGAGRRPGRW